MIRRVALLLSIGSGVVIADRPKDLVWGFVLAECPKFERQLQQGAVSRALFSPDQTQLALSVGHRLVVVPIDNPRRWCIVYETASAYQFTWSADSRTLSFVGPNADSITEADPPGTSIRRFSIPSGAKAVLRNLLVRVAARQDGLVFTDFDGNPVRSAPIEQHGQGVRLVATFYGRGLIALAHPLKDGSSLAEVIDSRTMNTVWKRRLRTGGFPDSLRLPIECGLFRDESTLCMGRCAPNALRPCEFLRLGQRAGGLRDAPHVLSFGGSYELRTDEKFAPCDDAHILCDSGGVFAHTTYAIRDIQRKRPVYKWKTREAGTAALSSDGRLCVEAEGGVIRLYRLQ